MVPYFGQSAYRCWLTVLECIGGEILCLSSVQMIVFLLDLDAPLNSVAISSVSYSHASHTCI